MPTTRCAGDAGARPSTIRVLSAADHDLFVRAFAAAARGDWAGAPGAGQPGPGHRRAPAAGMALCAGPQQRRQIRRDRCGDERWPTRPGRCAARCRPAPKPAITPDMTAGRRSSPGSARATPNSSIGQHPAGRSAGGDRRQGAAAAPLIRAGLERRQLRRCHRSRHPAPRTRPI